MEKMPSIAVINVPGDLDVRSVGDLRHDIDDLIDSGCLRIILNMGNVGFADSAGLGLIVSELRRMRLSGGLLSLTNVRPPVYKSLALMRMIDYMPISRAGSSTHVSELAPSVLPEWRTTFTVSPDNLGVARERVGELMRAMPFSEDDIFDMTLACGEAIGNAVDHTCACGVLATVSACKDRIVIDVADCGDGFELPADEEPLETGEYAERGRGIKLMRLLADAVSISPKPSGTGTVVRLVKLLKSTWSPASVQADTPSELHKHQA
jgi:serine/threonine-protein kinase RsbW